MYRHQDNSNNPAFVCNETSLALPALTMTSSSDAESMINLYETEDFVASSILRASMKSPYIVSSQHAGKF